VDIRVHEMRQRWVCDGPGSAVSHGKLADFCEQVDHTEVVDCQATDGEHSKSNAKEMTDLRNDDYETGRREERFVGTEESPSIGDLKALGQSVWGRAMAAASEPEEHQEGG
jgi:hypothetical protein